eukprot:9829622-Heterocapsa_arctica.AAC.1
MSKWTAPGGASASQQSSPPSPWSRDRQSAAQPAPADEWAQWACTNCSASNWCSYGAQKKRCRGCGVNRSYRSAAAPTA